MCQDKPFLIGQNGKAIGFRDDYKISNYFKISVDELLKNDTKIVEKIDDERGKRRKYFILSDSYNVSQEVALI